MKLGKKAYSLVLGSTITALLITMLYLTTGASYHQDHCRFDNQVALLVNPFDKTSYTTIDGLQMFLVDKKGNAKRNLKASSRRTMIPADTSMFWRNPTKPTDGVRAGEFLNHYPNGKTHYCYSLSRFSKGAYPSVKIVDTMSRRPGGPYKEVVVPLTDSNYMSLCLKKPFWHVPQWVAQHVVRVPLER